MIILFFFFVWQFGVPSFNKYINSGLVEDITRAQREQKDSPAVTVCTINNITNLGWKGDREVNINELSMIDVYCDEPSTVEDVKDCVDKKTFKLTETIKSMKDPVSHSIIGDPLYKVWRHTFLDFFSGKVLRDIIRIYFLLKP